MATYVASEAVVGPRDFARVINNIFLSLNFINRVKKKIGSQDCRCYFSEVRPKIRLLLAGYVLLKGNGNYCYAGYHPELYLYRVYSTESVLKSA